MPRTRKITTWVRKDKLTDTNTEMNQMLEWADKGFKVALIKILQNSIENSFETRAKVEIFSPETEVFFKETNGNDKAGKCIGNKKTPPHIVIPTYIYYSTWVVRATVMKTKQRHPLKIYVKMES